MKYARLTKEQLEEMHQEFSRFLATQGIDAEEWEEIKKTNPDLAEEEIDLFSDLVWEKVLRKVKFLEHLYKQKMFLFKVEDIQQNLIEVELSNKAIDLT